MQLQYNLLVIIKPPAFLVTFNLSWVVAGSSSTLTCVEALSCLQVENVPCWKRLITRSSLSSQGTEIYDAKRGALVDLGILDVMQIFGRAGRPQFDKYGEGTIITTHDKLSHYLTLLTQQNPIESQFLGSLPDNLNAEVRTQPTWTLLFLALVSSGKQKHGLCRDLIYSISVVLEGCCINKIEELTTSRLLLAEVSTRWRHNPNVDVFLLGPGGFGLRHQCGGSSEVAQLHLPVCPHEGQSSGLRYQPQGLSG